MRSLRPDRPARGRRWAALGFALALLWAQSLGLLHGVAHGPLGAAHAPRAVPASDDAASAWFDQHDVDSAQCRLVDQLAHHDALTPADLPLSTLAIACAAPAVQRAAAARQPVVYAFQARAPPVSAA